MASSAKFLGKVWRRVVGRAQPASPDLEPDFLAHYDACKRFSMTSVERMYALYQATLHIEQAGIAGDVVECGVWRGGSAMLVARALAGRGSSRTLYLYDTYEGMSAPTAADADFSGRAADAKWRAQAQKDHNDWCYAPLDEVVRNLASTGYPKERLRFVRGKVEDTIPGTVPERIALLRLDTDWYESTRHTLTHLYSRLVAGGVLIIDDYGHWRGCKQAVDEYFAAHPPAPLLTRVDYTGRMAVKG